MINFIIVLLSTGIFIMNLMSVNFCDWLFWLTASLIDRRGRWLLKLGKWNLGPFSSDIWLWLLNRRQPSSSHGRSVGRCYLSALMRPAEVKVPHWAPTLSHITVVAECWALLTIQMVLFLFSLKDLTSMIYPQFEMWNSSFAPVCFIATVVTI